MKHWKWQLAADNFERTKKTLFFLFLQKWKKENGEEQTTEPSLEKLIPSGIEVGWQLCNADTSTIRRERKIFNISSWCQFDCVCVHCVSLWSSSCYRMYEWAHVSWVFAQKKTIGCIALLHCRNIALLPSCLRHTNMSVCPNVQVSMPWGGARVEKMDSKDSRKLLDT